MLKKLRIATLYTALSLTAIPVAAMDLSAIEALRADSMRKLVFHKKPRAAQDDSIVTRDGDEVRFADFEGQLVIVNYWATWCGPCREEMPALNALAKNYEDQGLVVLPIATGRNPAPAIDAFFEESGVDALETRLDPKGRNARSMGVLGLPATLVLSPDGQEIARMAGDADWFSPSAQSIIEALLKHYEVPSVESLTEN